MFSRDKLLEEFEYFLKGFKGPDGTEKYRVRVSQAVLEGKTSIFVDFEDLLTYNADLAAHLISHPDRALDAFKEAAYETMRVEDLEYANKIRPILKVRIKTLPDKVPLRAISAKQVDQMVSVGGMVVRASEVKPLVVMAAFKCPQGHISFVEQKSMVLQKPKKCEDCEETKQFELDKRLSIFTDYQILRLQELPEELPPGQLPQSIDVIVTGDMTNMARPGDRVIVTGIVRAEPERVGGKSQVIFKTSLEASYIEVLGKGPDRVELSPEDVEEIKSIASQPDAYEKLIQSVAPSIYGYETEKEAILLLVAGAPQQTLPDGTTMRGDINILLVGDPGTAKSELLKYVARVAPRGLYTSGRGSTAAGLTAAVVKEKSGIMMLEAGAVVLADQGIAAIDEFDKMRPEDRSVLHEVMEQQTVSVAKGGIVATLNARTSILAAANPIYGKYDVYKNIYENINLPIPLLTRFDLIYIMRDVPDRTRDEHLARHILETHRKGYYAREPPIPFEKLRKYLAYCKRVSPKLTREAEEKLLEFYVEMRAESAREGTITITPRQLESLIRLAAARARVLLKEVVTEEDALRAISLMKRMLSTVGIDVRSKKIDLGVLHGRPMSEKGLIDTALELVEKLQGDEGVEERKLIEEMMKTGKYRTREEAYKVLNTLLRNGQIYEVKPGKYSKLRLV